MKTRRFTTALLAAALLCFLIPVVCHSPLDDLLPLAGRRFVHRFDMAGMAGYALLLALALGWPLRRDV